MVAARTLNGHYRELWNEPDPHVGGPLVRVITTTIRVKRPTTDGSRVRAALYLYNLVGAPQISGVVSISATGFVVVTVTNAATAADSALYTLEVELIHSIQQANDAALPAGICVTLLMGHNPANLPDHMLRHINGGGDELLQAARVDAVGVPITAADYLILGDGAAPIQMQLPAAVAGIIGREYVIKNIAVAAAITVLRAGADLIDGAVNVVLPLQYDSVTIRCTAVGAWSIVERYPIAAAHAATHLNGAGDPIRQTVRTPAAGACVIAVTDHYVRAASLGAGAVAATLYAADAAAVGREVTIVKIDAAADDVEVTRAGADTINGGAGPHLLAAQWNYVTLICVAVGQWEIKNAG
jgi:hypothetical protein